MLAHLNTASIDLFMYVFDFYVIIMLAHVTFRFQYCRNSVQKDPVLA